MKKIFLFFAAVSLLFACDPTSEDISNGGNITAEQLKAMSTVTVDKDANGQNGNVITCNTTAPVESVRYFDAMGRESAVPFEGINIVVARHSVGSALLLVAHHHWQRTLPRREYTSAGNEVALMLIENL